MQQRSHGAFTPFHVALMNEARGNGVSALAARSRGAAPNTWGLRTNHTPRTKHSRFLSDLCGFESASHCRIALVAIDISFVVKRNREAKETLK